VFLGDGYDGVDGGLRFMGKGRCGRVPPPCAETPRGGFRVFWAKWRRVWRNVEECGGCEGCGGIRMSQVKGIGVLF